MPISAGRSDGTARRARGLDPRARRAAFELKAIRDLTFGIGRARNFDESIRVALLAILGTFSIPGGILFLDEDGEFRASVSRGLPPGVPPVGRSPELVRSMRGAHRPVSVAGRGAPAAVREAVAQVVRAVPAFTPQTFCPLGTRTEALGMILLGRPLSGAGLSPLQREVLAVMAAVLSAHISHHRGVREGSRLNDVLHRQVAANARLLREMEDLYLDTIRALAAAIDAKDSYTRGHSERVAKISVRIAEGLDLPEGDVDAVRVASLLHDLGKIGTERAILSKDSALTRAELREIRRHPRASYDILSEIRFPYPDVALLARHHHERVDGSGYPDGKREQHIPIGARIIAVADSLDAMTTDRPYRQRLPLLHALREIDENADRQFDPVVVGALFRAVRREIGGESPSGVFCDAANGSRRRDIIAFIDGALAGPRGFGARGEAPGPNC